MHHKIKLHTTFYSIKKEFIYEITKRMLHPITKEIRYNIEWTYLLSNGHESGNIYDVGYITIKHFSEDD